MTAVGVDLVDRMRITRMLDTYEDAALACVFTSAELLRAGRQRGRATDLGLCFGVKEALAKALGCGIGPVTWTDIEADVTEETIHLTLHGRAAEMARELRLCRWFAAWTDLGTALMVLVLGQDQDDPEGRNCCQVT
jgi:holo-[acyl-carrier protein] synthase